MGRPAGVCLRTARCEANLKAGDLSALRDPKGERRFGGARRFGEADGPGSEGPKRRRHRGRTAAPRLKPQARWKVEPEARCDRRRGAVASPAQDFMALFRGFHLACASNLGAAVRPVSSPFKCLAPRTVGLAESPRPTEPSLPLGVAERRKVARLRVGLPAPSQRHHSDIARNGVASRAVSRTSAVAVMSAGAWPDPA